MLIKIVKLYKHCFFLSFLRVMKIFSHFSLILKQTFKKFLQNSTFSWKNLKGTVLRHLVVRLISDSSVRPSVSQWEMKLMSCSKPTKAAYCGWKWNGRWVSARFNKSISSPPAKFRRIISAVEFCHHNYASSSSRSYLFSAMAGT